MSVFRPSDEPTMKGAARQKAMLEAAWTALIEKGFSGVTLSDIINLSGGSKATLYATFSSKENLLIQAVEVKIQSFIGQLNISLKADISPATALREYALTYTGRIVEPDAIRFYHLLMSENQHMAPVIRQFISAGPIRNQDQLATYLRAATEAGKLKIADPEKAADLFLAMLQGQGILNIFTHTLTGDLLEAHKQKVKDRAIAAVELFLNATQAS